MGYTAPSAKWPEPLSEEAFDGLAGDVVRELDPHTESDRAAILLTFLDCFGNAVGSGPHAVAEADRHGCNLFVCLVGETSKGRKGSSLGHIKKLFSMADPVWNDSRVMSGLSSGEGLIFHVRDQQVSTKKGVEEVTDTGVSDKRLLVVESEFAGTLKVLARDGNTLSATVRQAFDTGDLRIMSKNSPAKASGAHVSILGHVTRAELVRYLSDTEQVNGFANRFLWACVKRSKILPDGGGVPNYGVLAPRLGEALRSGRLLERLPRDEEARTLWHAVYEALSEGKPGLLGAVTSRAEAIVLRLSVLYAVLAGSPAIQGRHLASALAIWDYCQASAEYIFGQSTGDPLVDRIEALLRQSPEGLTRTAIYNALGRNIKSDKIDQALQLLQRYHRATSDRQCTDGRTAEVWRPLDAQA